MTRPAEPEAPRGSNWVAITTAAVGGVVLLGTMGAAAAGAAFSANVDPNLSPQLLTADAAGVTGIEVDASASSFTITCEGPAGRHEDDEGEYVLSASTGSREWRMERRGDTLRVEPVNRWFGGFSLFGPLTDQPQSVSLLLPSSVCEQGDGETANSTAARLDADLEVGAGSMQVDGRFGSLALDLGAGYVCIDGEVEDLEADVSAGEAVLYLSDVSTADFTVSAGKLRGSLEGSAPDRVGVEVSAGSLDLWLPDERYAVRSEVSFGGFENDLQTDDRAERRIDVELSAGSARLHRQG